MLQCNGNNDGDAIFNTLINDIANLCTKYKFKIMGEM